MDITLYGGPLDGVVLKMDSPGPTILVPIPHRNKFTLGSLDAGTSRDPVYRHVYERCGANKAYYKGWVEQ